MTLIPALCLGFEKMYWKVAILYSLVAICRQKEIFLSVPKFNETRRNVKKRVDR